MKNFIVSIAMLLAGSMASFSQGVTATLQHGDQTQIYYGYKSLVNAYNDCHDGDVITLSKGDFETIGKLDKGVTIIGSYAFDPHEKSTSITDLSVSAANAGLSGIRFTNLNLSLSNNLKITRCHIENLTADTTHVRTLIEDCSLRNDFSLSRGVDECFRRTEIYQQHRRNSPDNMAVFEYCTILGPVTEIINLSHYYPDAMLASYGLYRNCALYSSYMHGQSMAPIHLNRQSDYKDLMVFGRSGYFVPDGTLTQYLEHRYVASDSASTLKINFPTFFESEIVIPQAGGWEYKAPVGCTGHKSYPAIPRIVESVIDRETDENGKLKISLKAVIED